VEGSLWKNDMIQNIDEAPCGMTRIVVGVDPAGTANPKSDLTGIIACGVGEDKNYYVFSDLSGKYSPEKWARTANDEYARLVADAIVAERNFGEDMVRFTLENSGFKGARIKMVRSRRGKAIRAEPIVALYEKGKVFHVGQLTELEDEQTSWIPGQGASPNRVDALVHAMTDLVAHAQPGSFASPNDLRRRLGDRFYGTG
jgi:phage terminase large subunit-like protein